MSIKHGWPFKSAEMHDSGTGQPIVVSVGNFDYSGGFRFGSTNEREYRGAYPPEYELSPGDLLLVMTCQTAGGEILGIPGRIPDDGRVYLHNQRLGKVEVLHPDLIDSDYLYWLFLSRDFNLHLFKTATGSKILHTAPKRIESFEWRLPPLPEQRAIAGVLGSLDDKIELNRRMNRTLESMARALFRHHFLDHPDPAWEVKPASEVLQINPKREIKKGAVAPYLDMKNVPSDSHLADEVIDREFKSGSKFVNGDTLLARITPCLENGKTAFVDFLDEGTTGWGSTEFIVLRPVEGLPVEYGYHLARSDEFRAHAIQSMTGTSGRQRVPNACFDQLMVTVPPPGVAEDFGTNTRLLMDRIRHNDAESRTLASLRDALLPRLLYGEL